MLNCYKLENFIESVEELYMWIYIVDHMNNTGN